MRKSFLVLFVLFVVVVLVLALSLQRFVLNRGAPDQTEASSSSPPVEKIEDTGDTTMRGLSDSATVAQAGQESPSARPSAVGVPTPGFKGIDGLALRLSRPLMLDAPSIHGLAMTDRFIYVSAFEPEHQAALLFQLHRDEHTVAQVRNLGQGGSYAPGGIDAGDRYLWMPLAEAAGLGFSLILGVDTESLQVAQSFTVMNYVVAVAEGPNGHIYGLNGNSTAVFEWATDGRELRRKSIATGARYQDAEIVGNSLVCAGIDSTGGVIDVIELGSFSLLSRHRCHARDLEGQIVTGKGFAIADGIFYFLPGEGHFPMLMSYVLDGTTLEEYIPSVGS